MQRSRSQSPDHPPPTVYEFSWTEEHKESNFQSYSELRKQFNQMLIKACTYVNGLRFIEHMISGMKSYTTQSAVNAFIIEKNLDKISINGDEFETFCNLEIGYSLVDQMGQFKLSNDLYLLRVVGDNGASSLFNRMVTAKYNRFISPTYLSTTPDMDTIYHFARDILGYHTGGRAPPVSLAIIHIPYERVSKLKVLPIISAYHDYEKQLTEVLVPRNTPLHFKGFIDPTNINADVPENYKDANVQFQRIGFFELGEQVANTPENIGFSVRNMTRNPTKVNQCVQRINKMLRDLHPETRQVLPDLSSRPVNVDYSRCLQLAMGTRGEMILPTPSKRLDEQIQRRRDVSPHGRYVGDSAPRVPSLSSEPDIHRRSSMRGGRSSKKRHPHTKK